MTARLYPAVLEKGPKKTFAAWMPDFPDAVAAGTTQEQALEKLDAREREAAIRQVMDAINQQAGQMSRLANELRAALDAGTATSDSLNTTIRSPIA